jgi:hypothetical protein
MVALNVCDPFTGVICDYFGRRQADLVGASLMILSLVLTTFLTTLWVLYLTQCLFYGIKVSLAYF